MSSVSSLSWEGDGKKSEVFVITNTGDKNGRQMNIPLQDTIGSVIQKHQGNTLEERNWKIQSIIAAFKLCYLKPCSTHHAMTMAWKFAYFFGFSKALSLDLVQTVSYCQQSPWVLKSHQSIICHVEMWFFSGNWRDIDYASCFKMTSAWLPSITYLCPIYLAKEFFLWPVSRMHMDMWLACSKDAKILSLSWISVAYQDQFDVYWRIKGLLNIRNYIYENHTL